METKVGGVPNTSLGKVDLSQLGIRAPRKELMLSECEGDEGPPAVGSTSPAALLRPARPHLQTPDAESRDGEWPRIGTAEGPSRDRPFSPWQGRSPQQSEERRPGTGRFYTEELTCFKRVPSPSALCNYKAEVYWQSLGGRRRLCSDSGLHALPSGKGNFFCSSREVLGPQEPVVEHTQSECLFERRTAAAAMLPLEDRTASVLDKIYPRSPSPVDQQEEQSPPLTRVPSQRGLEVKATASMSSPTLEANRRAEPKKNGPSIKLMQFRQKILDRFSTMKTAFEHFVDSTGSGTKELPRNEFSRFLNKHIGGLSREEHEQIFDFLDSDRNGAVSAFEFDQAIEAASPVRTIDDLRKKWIALGFSSMRQAINQMERYKETPGRLTEEQLGAVLSKVGILDQDEHENIFEAISNPNNPGSVSLSELASALAAVSPSILLEDIHDRLMKKYGSILAAYRVIDVNKNVSLTYAEFMQYAAHHWRMSTHEAQKAFRLIDFDRSRGISRTEFVSALKISEATLLLEEIRRKVKLRFRQISGSAEKPKGQEPEGGTPQQSTPGRAFSNSRDPEGQKANPATAGPAARSSEGAFLPLLLGLLGGGAGPAKGPEHGRRGGRAASKETYLLLKGQEQLTKLQTPQELQTFLLPVNLTEQDTKTLFDLVDIDRDGRLTPFEFVRGIRLFAPSCMLESLRLRCLRNHSCVADAFAGIPGDQHNTVLDSREMKAALDELDLTTGVNVQAVMDLVEPHRTGGMSISELIAALQSVAPRCTVALPPDQRDARARQQIRWQMAPFHRTATEIRLHVRQRLSYEDSEPTASGGAPERQDSEAAAPAPKPPTPQRKAGKEGHARSSNAAGAEHPPMKQSYSKVSCFLRVMEPKDSDPILEQLHCYYASAGSKMANDKRLLSKQQSRWQHFRTASGHYKVLARPLM